MKLTALILLWALSNTAGALVCQTCADQTCSFTMPFTCSSETMCVTANIQATSSGTMTTQIFKACAASSLCPATGSQAFSAHLGAQSALASATCCNTDNCNLQTQSAPAPQSNNGRQCNTCSGTQCNTPLQCQGVEDQCFQSTITNSNNIVFPAYGCVSANLCAAAKSLGSLPFMNSVGNITTGPTCNPAPTTTAAPSTTTAATTTTVPTTTTTTAATTTTSATTTTPATTATTTTPTTTTAAITATTTTSTTTTASTTKSDACCIRLGMIHLLLGLLFIFH